MKAALYFDTAEGFGDWHIIISTQADKDLRKAHRADKRRFQIYLKKIKYIILSTSWNMGLIDRFRELSNGHFSGDNQKPLAGSSNDIPIFEAKMTSDSRLVVCRHSSNITLTSNSDAPQYQIDCIKEFGEEVRFIGNIFSFIV